MKSSEITKTKRTIPIYQFQNPIYNNNIIGLVTSLLLLLDYLDGILFYFVSLICFTLIDLM